MLPGASRCGRGSSCWDEEYFLGSLWGREENSPDYSIVSGVMWFILFVLATGLLWSMELPFNPRLPSVAKLWGWEVLSLHLWLNGRRESQDILLLCFSSSPGVPN